MKEKTTLEIATAGNARELGQRIRRDRERTPAELKKLMAPKENVEQKILFQWADVHSNLLVRLLYAVPNSGGFTGGFEKNVRRVQGMKKEGVRKGFPDVGLPVARGNYHGLFIELKRTCAVPSDTKPEQILWKIALEEQGFLVLVCKGAEDAQEAIERYLANGFL